MSKRRGRDGRALADAVMGGSCEEVRALIAAGADVNARCANGTPLLMAVRQGSLRMVEALIAAGADVNKDDGTYCACTALHVAVKNGRTDLARALIAAGANVNEHVIGYSALHIAVKNDRLDLANALLAAGADVNERVGGYSALHIAVSNDRVEMVSALIAAGADVNVRCGNGTPLLLAVRHGSTAVAKLLVEAGATVDFKCRLSAAGQGAAVTEAVGGRRVENFLMVSVLFVACVVLAAVCYGVWHIASQGPHFLVDQLRIVWHSGSARAVVGTGAAVGLLGAIVPMWSTVQRGRHGEEGADVSVYRTQLGCLAWLLCPLVGAVVGVLGAAAGIRFVGPETEVYFGAGASFVGVWCARKLLRGNPYDGAQVYWDPIGPPPPDTS